MVNRKLTGRTGGLKSLSEGNGEQNVRPPALAATQCSGSTGEFSIRPMNFSCPSLRNSEDDGDFHQHHGEISTKAPEALHRDQINQRTLRTQARKTSSDSRGSDGRSELLSEFSRPQPESTPPVKKPVAVDL